MGGHGDRFKSALTAAVRRPTLPVMDLDELFPSRPEDPLIAAAKQDLDPLSQHELAARIVALEAEIVRTRNHMNKAAQHRSAADDLFKR